MTFCYFLSHVIYAFSFLGHRENLFLYRFQYHLYSSSMRPRGYDPRPSDADYVELYQQVQFNESSYYPSIGLENAIHLYGDMKPLTFPDFHYSFILFPKLKTATLTNRWPTFRIIKPFELEWINQIELLAKSGSKFSFQEIERNWNSSSGIERVKCWNKYFRGIPPAKEITFLPLIHRLSIFPFKHIKKIKASKPDNEKLVLDLMSLWTESFRILSLPSQGLHLDVSSLTEQDTLEVKEFLIYMVHLSLSLCFSSQTVGQVFIPYPSTKWLRGSNLSSFCKCGKFSHIPYRSIFIWTAHPSSGERNVSYFVDC